MLRRLLLRAFVYWETRNVHPEGELWTKYEEAAHRSLDDFSSVPVVLPTDKLVLKTTSIIGYQG